MRKNNVFMKAWGNLYILVLSGQLLIASSNENPPIIQPGAPGEPSKNLDASAATNIANTAYIKSSL